MRMQINSGQVPTGEIEHIRAEFAHVFTEAISPHLKGQSRPGPYLAHETGLGARGLLVDAICPNHTQIWVELMRREQLQKVLNVRSGLQREIFNQEI